MSRLLSFVRVLFVLLVLFGLVPAAAYAEDAEPTLDNFAYMPFLEGPAEEVPPKMVHIQSCQGRLAIDAPPNEDKCPPGASYPEFAQTEEVVVVQAIQAVDWSLSFHMTNVNGAQRHFKVVLNNNITVAVENGEITLKQDDMNLFIDSQENPLEGGWTFQRIGALEAVILRHGAESWYGVYDGDSLWIDVDMPVNNLKGGLMKAAYENNGEMPADYHVFITGN